MEQLVAILKQVELGIPVTELIRQVGYRSRRFAWWKKYGGKPSLEFGFCGRPVDG